MKKLFIYALTALAALSSVSCKDDDVTFEGANDLDRMPMTLFRRGANEGPNDENDPFVSGVDKNVANTIHLRWYGIKGSAGYEIKYAVGQGGLGEEWNNPDRMVEVIKIDDPDQTEIQLDNLSYDTYYCFAIRVLSPKGEPYHSKWYGIGSLSEWDDVCMIQTSERNPAPPSVVYPAEDRDKTSFTVVFNLNFADAGVEDNEAFRNAYEIDAEGNFVVHRLQIKPDADYVGKAEVPAKYQDYVLSDEEKSTGRVKIEGLTPNSVYEIYMINDNKIFTDPRTGKLVTVDAEYNPLRVRTKGDPAAAITIEHIVDQNDTIPGAVQYNACRIDTILSNYNTDSNMAEGQTFYLRGGKAYYFCQAFDITKGFNLETHPDDLAAGLHAKVYLGGMSYNEKNEVASVNFNFGRAKRTGESDAPIVVESVVFRGIDFDCPLAENYGEYLLSKRGKDGTGNYFVNMNSNGMAVTMESIEWHDCTFQRLIRGFIRTQGSKAKVFKKVVMENCVHYNSGYYGKDARGYSWFDIDKKNNKTNAFVNVQFRNNTFYMSPRDHFFDNSDGIPENGDWGPGIQYNITLENNTFINFSTQKSGRFLFNLRYVPGGSKFTIKKNLFVLAAADDDNRGLTNSACDIRTINGSGEIEFDVADNYSVGCRDEHLKDNGIWSSYGLNASSRSFGAFLNAKPGLTSGNRSDLDTKVGSTPLKATDLFTNPNPPYHASGNSDYSVDRYKAPDNLFEALRYKQTDLVHNHEIWTLNIGDPRWRN